MNMKVTTSEHKLLTVRTALTELFAEVLNLNTTTRFIASLARMVTRNVIMDVMR